MAYAIIAEFPLGFYQGKDRFGATEHYPSFNRTYSSLVGAAYARARLLDTDLTAGDHETLDWLEHHAPDAITLPKAKVNLGDRARAFRRKGWGQNANANAPDKPAASERAVARSALDGPVAWWWADEPPAPVVERIGEYCAEVPYLGEASSPVRLTSLQNHEIPDGIYARDDQSINSAGAVAFDLPESGRADVLQEAFEAVRGSKIPTAAKDRARQSTNAEADQPDPWPEQAIRQQVLYTPLQQHTINYAPWTLAYLLYVKVLRPVQQRYWRPDERDLVRWAEATHRAIVKQLGSDVSGLITGRYAPGEMPPPNRVAIHILDASMPLATELQDAVGTGHSDHAALLVTVPGVDQGAEPEDLSRIQTALAGIHRIALNPQKVIEITDIALVDATAIWQTPDNGVQRWWLPHPFIVAESRPPARKVLGGRMWTADDAVRVAVGNVFRNHPELRTTTRGDRRLVELSALVHQAGVRIGSPHRVYPSEAGRYVHRMNPNTVITAVQGLINLGSLTNGRALVAIGQSRHFGGGLLVPFDLPALPDAAGGPGASQREDS